MKINIVKIVAVCMILLGMIGIAAASNCPTSWNKPVDDRVIVLEETVGNVATYYVRSNVATIINDPEFSGFKALCIKPSGGFLGTNDDLTVYPPSWDKGIKHNFTEFTAQGDPTNLPMNNVNQKVGSVDYTAHGGLPASIETLVHVRSQEICGGTNQDPNTCFVKPSKPTIPVPELNSIILVSAGLLGLGLVVRKFKR